MSSADKSLVKFSPKAAADECMYTGEKLDGSVEHILPESIGGTLKSDALIGSRINALSSTVLEPALFKPLEILCYHLGIPGKKGERRLRLPMADGRIVELGTDLRPTILEKPKPTILRTPEQLIISIQSTDYAQMQKIARSAAGEDKDKLKEVAVSVREDPLKPIPVSFSFGGALWLNAIRKSSLSLLGYFDPALARSDELEEARFLVLMAITHPRNELPSCQCLGLLDGDSIISELGVPELGPVDHLLVVSCEPQSQRIVAFLRLLGHIDSALLLSSTYHGPARSFVYRRNPISRDTGGTMIRQVDWACHAMTRFLSISTDERVAILRAALEKALRQATARFYGKAFHGLPDQAIPEWFIRTGSMIDSSERFKESAHAFVRDFLRVVDISDLLDESARSALTKNLGDHLSLGYAEFSGKSATTTLKREIGARWVKLLGDEFEAALEAIADKSDAEQ